MRCIFCLQERPPSEEHIIPNSLDGTLTTDRVCTACNSTLGTRIDAALIDFLPIKHRRAELGLAGYRGNVPSKFATLEGVHDAIGPNGEKFRLKTKFNKETGQLEQERITHTEVRDNPDGTKTLHFAVDAANVDDIPRLIQRQRAKLGLRPLTEDELEAETAKGVAGEVKNHVVQAHVQTSFAFLRHAMMKIAYELAFLWLGEEYVDDPLAVRLRAAIMSEDRHSTDTFPGYVGWAEPCDAVKFWNPHKAHHIAFAELAGGSISVVVRIFDIWAICIKVSNDPGRYITSQADSSKLRFVAIDAQTRRVIESSFEEERYRLGAQMTRLHRPPPFPDPLEPLAFE